ncbi:ketoreductase [Fusarium circinatum]|uniref:Ketoreductase n=1 Tax=Fusarium circinatum TaxID=48490 RepID=A0A8H5X660_FUSCI|nr:ketoreductase [Fusarium circinatum]
MVSSNNTVWVVTGGNRGIGLGFVKALLVRPSVTVIATVRNDQARTALEDATIDLFKGDGAILSIVRLNFTTALSPDQIRKLFDIDHVDVLINNAAASFKSYPILEIQTGDLRSAFEINTIGPLTNEGLVAFALHPGFVNTEMGESAATKWGFPHAMLEGVEEAVKGSLGIIDRATRENVSGKFVSYKGQELPW